MHDIIIFATFASAGIFVQSCFGFGGSLTAIPLLTLFLAPKQAIPTYSILMMLMDAWLVFHSREHIRWGRVGMLLLGGCIGIPIGVYGLKYLPASVIRFAIGTVTFVFALLYLCRVRINLRENTPTQLGVGLTSGILQGSIAESGPPIVIYGMAREWDKNAFRTTLLCYFCCLATFTVITNTWLGLITRKIVLSAASAVVPAFLVSNLGIHLKNRISDVRFRYVMLAIIMSVSILSLVRAFR